MLTFDNKNFYIDGHKQYFSSGEIHYFRVPKKDWRKRLRLLRESGANAVATYVPWRLHEPEDGVFKVDCGDGITDLSDFLRCAAEEGLMTIVRPGPYAYSELVKAGIPDWLVANHPEILAVNRQGKPFKDFSISYQHPVFLRYVRRYYEKILPVLARFQDGRDGSIVLLQLDNELTGIHLWFSGLDYNEESMEFGKADGHYARFLEQRHGCVDRVNALYGTNCRSFADFTLAHEPETGIEKQRWNNDYYDFYCERAADYLETLGHWARELGITVPFCHNSGGPSLDGIFKSVKKRFGASLLLGTDHYYTLSQLWAQNNPTPQFFINCFNSMETMRTMGNPPCVFEAQYGTITDWPKVAPEDMRAMLFFHLAMGMRGHNGYIFTGGPNPPGHGCTTDIYDYGAPVDADGNIRPSYHVIKEFGDFLNAHPELIDDAPDYDFRILPCENDYKQIPELDNPATMATQNEMKNHLLRGILSCSFASGHQPHFADENNFDNDFSTPLVVHCAGSMPRRQQQRLAQWILNGGKALLTPCIPAFDENLEPCTVFAEAAGCIPNVGRLDAFSSAHLFSILNMYPITGKAESFTAELPAGAELLGTCGNQCVAYGLNAGKGKLIWLGMNFILESCKHIDMWGQLLKMLGVETKWHCDNPWLMTLRRKTSKGTAIFVSNLGSSAQHAQASYMNVKFNLELAPMEVRFLEC